MYRVVANRLLVLYGLEWSETSLNPLRYYLDEDCKYNEWTDESQRALNWYYLATPASTDFFNHEDSGITPLERTLSIIGNLQVYRYRHDSVKPFRRIAIRCRFIEYEPSDRYEARLLKGLYQYGITGRIHL